MGLMNEPFPLAHGPLALLALETVIVIGFMALFWLTNRRE